MNPPPTKIWYFAFSSQLQPGHTHSSAAIWAKSLHSTLSLFPTNQWEDIVKSCKVAFKLTSSFVGCDSDSICEWQSCNRGPSDHIKLPNQRLLAGIYPIHTACRCFGAVVNCCIHESENEWTQLQGNIVVNAKFVTVSLETTWLEQQKCQPLSMEWL